MSIEDTFSPKLTNALRKSTPCLQQVFLQIIKQVAEETHCRHRSIKNPNYRFYSGGQFCGMTPQSRKDRIKVGITDGQARVTSDVLKMKRLKGVMAKWTEFDVDPHDLTEVTEAVRIITRVWESVR